ncbi:MAG: GNAT family N-acetyltransferase [Bacilli bacterium]|nr:GNAT family N-acetyltransferase [Bacilli bacterium]
MIKRVLEPNIASECDKLLSKLIAFEQKFDSLSKPLIVENYFANCIESESNILMAAMVDDKVVGFAYFKAIVNNEVYGYLLDCIYVLDEYRHQGLASNLIEEGLKIVLTHPIKFVDVKCFYDNDNACMLYQKYGFKPYKVLLRKIVD